MKEGARFQVDSTETAREALEHFSAFHDGFMKHIAIASHDSIDAEFAQSCSGRYEVTIRFSHYNYPAGKLQRHDNQVIATFLDVQDVFFNLASTYLGSPIIQLSVESSQRLRGGTTSQEDCLALSLGRHLYCEPERRFDYREERLFTFLTAELIGLDNEA